MFALPAMAFGLKGMAIAALVSGAIVGGAAWKVRSAFCDAAAARLQNQSVELDNRAGDQLNTSARTTADAVEQTDIANQEVQRDIINRPHAADGVCRLSADDAARLFKLQ